MAFGTAALQNMTVYMQNTFINHVLRSGGTSGSSAWLGLYYFPVGSGFPTEITGGSYARLKVSGSWTVTNGSALNKWDLSFWSATTDWGGITHIAILNDSVSGSALFWGQLSASQTVLTGDKVTFLANNITVNLLGSYAYYSANALLNHYLNNITFTSPGASVYLALYITTPNRNDTGAIELSGSTTYSRKQVGGAGSWTTPITGSTTNISMILFSSQVATDWGTITAAALRDAPAGGNMLFLGSIYPPITVLSPDGFKFDPGGLKVSAYAAVPPT